MAPGLLGTELAATPPHYMQPTMEEKFFPPISRKSAISLGSETDSSDYCSSHDRKTHTRGSMPASLSSSPVKFPTIDRANSTSVASLPGSRATRHRSKGRDLRASYCRSPSCPSHLDISRDFSRVDFAVLKRDTRMDSDLSQSESPRNDSHVKEESSKLPNIFSKDYNAHIDKSKHTRREKARDKSNTLSLRRSESLVNTFSSAPTHHPVVGSLTSRDAGQRQGQGQSTALLLPIRSEAQVNKRKKKNKRRSRVNSDSDNENDSHEITPRNNFAGSDRQHRFAKDNDAALEVIARENDINHGDDMDTPTPRAIEINSRKVKQWMNGTRASQNEGEIKA